MQRSATHSNTGTQQHSNTATQQHSNTTTQQRTVTTTHYRPRRSKSNMYRDIQTHSAATTHTTTLHSQEARQHGSNTQRRRGIAHSPTTPSSSVECSHSAHRTLAARCRSRCRLLHYSSATLRLRHARSRDMCRASAQHGLPATAAATHNTRKTPLPHCNAAVTHACTQRSETHTHEQSTTNNRKQCCAVTHQPQRDAVQQRTRDDTKPQSQYCRKPPVTALETTPAMHAQDTHCTSRESRSHDSLHVHLRRPNEHLAHTPTN
jgi:hypothetical protein